MSSDRISPAKLSAAATPHFDCREKITALVTRNDQLNMMVGLCDLTRSRALPLFLVLYCFSGGATVVQLPHFTHYSPHIYNEITGLKGNTSEQVSFSGSADRMHALLSSLVSFPPTQDTFPSTTGLKS